MKLSAEHIERRRVKHAVEYHDDFHDRISKMFEDYPGLTMVTITMDGHIDIDGTCYETRFRRPKVRKLKQV